MFRFRFPSRFRERLVEVPFDGAMLRVFTLSNEDLVIVKMLAWRDQDKEDISSMLAAGNIDIGGLRAIIDDITELKPNLDDAQWEAFREHVDELESWADR